MLTSLSVKNYRNLKSLTLEDLGRITLIAGKNGVGKTALLEALWLLSGPDLPELSTRVDAFRGLPLLGQDKLFHTIFHNFDPQDSIEMVANGDWGSRQRILQISLRERQQVTTIRSNAPQKANIGRLTRPEDEGEFEIVFTYTHNNGKRHVSRGWWIAEQLTPAGAVPPVTVTGEGLRQERQPISKRPTSVFMAAVHRENLQTTASRLGQLQLTGADAEIIDVLRPLEPRLKRLIAITIKDTPIIHAYIKGTNRPVPVQLLGEGFNRMLALALSANEATGGLILVDEIENGLHHSVQQAVFSNLLRLAKSFDVQMFATTHSHECIRAAHRALKKQKKEEFVYYQLERVNGDIKTNRFDREMLDTADLHDMEIR